MLFMLRYAVTLCWNCLEYCEYRISFVIYGEQEIRPWTHMMDVPQLHGLGPAANRLLESYSQLLKASPPAPCHWQAQNKLSIVKYSFGVVVQLLRNLQKMRDSYSAVAAGSDVAADAGSEESSLVKLVAECEEALLLLNNGLSILSLSLDRDFHWRIRKLQTRPVSLITFLKRIIFIIWGSEIIFSGSCGSPGTHEESPG